MWASFEIAVAQRTHCLGGEAFLMDGAVAMKQARVLSNYLSDEYFDR